MQRVLRFLLVCFLAAAMPLKGMAALRVPAGGWTPAAGVAHAATGVPAAGHALHALHGSHGAHMVHGVAGGATPPPCGGMSAFQATHGAAHADDPSGMKHAPVTPKCSACDACATAAPLPARAPHVAPPQARPARFQPLAPVQARFLTGAPERPPRHRLA